VSIINTDLIGLALYIISVIIYHNGEFLFVCFNHYYELSWNSNKYKIKLKIKYYIKILKILNNNLHILNLIGFLINHSTEYTIVFLMHFVEFGLEYYFWS